MSARIDLHALLERAQADNDLIGIWVNKAEVAALVRAVRAAERHHAEDNDETYAELEDSLAPFTGGDT